SLVINDRNLRAIVNVSGKRALAIVTRSQFDFAGRIDVSGQTVASLVQRAAGGPGGFQGGGQQLFAEGPGPGGQGAPDTENGPPFWSGGGGGGAGAAA